ncbi:uncharacterized protein LOC123879073 isoform X2 [Maniola jurtina]|uniref:uncharacterized protein LOC123879073 isoform X2 n=1 Tax=Maniola jurtina TaxID=191418 RepID=UPI001E687C8F|nr:uncharacterized protein LOC123879073 isoform X2 [Maniola jurtina]
MGLSNKSHGRKSDKETQSPMLKIFKDIMQKEKTDPEKTNLLKSARNKLREKKRKYYSDSRPKTDNYRSYDSSSTDRGTHKTNKHGKITVQNIQEAKNENPSRDRSGSSAFADGRRESWRFWKDNKFTSKNKSDDTCSCVSCAVKKFCSSEYTCVACLLILFSVSVTVAFLMVFKTMPSMEEVTEKAIHSENLKKKIQMLKEKRQLTESYGYEFTEKSKWDDSLNPVGSYSNILGSEYTGNSYKGSNIMDDLETGMSEDLASILDNEKRVEGQNNQRLKDFFKKLIQTDVQIRKLKQSINNNYQIDNLKPITDRFKRSVKMIKGKHRFRPFGKTTVTMQTKMNTSKETVVKSKKDDKRSVTDNNVGLTGYVIESKEVVIRYDTDKKRKFPKCSHVHEEKSHEKKLKHPYYKHSQRVDEMLETYKKPDDTTENFDVIYDITESLKTKPDSDKDNDESVTKLITKIAKPKTNGKNDDEKSFIIAKTESYDRENSKMNDYEKRNEDQLHYRRFNDESDGLTHRHHHLTTTTTTSSTVKDMTDGDTSDTSSDFDYNMEKFLSTAPLYDLALSVSTFINPTNREVLRSKLPRNQHLGQRNLLQVNEEDEEKEDLIYDDLKEVLTDDREGHDDMDRHGERKKRDYEEKIAIPEDFNQNKHSVLNVINPNWKGPMPLYPDELNAMIKQAALQNVYMYAPLNTRDSKVKRNIDEKVSAMSDTQYIEDYTNKKYDKLAKMAQAYSDYGVLYNKGNTNFNDKGMKSSYMKRFKKLFNRQTPLGRYVKGFRFEIKDGSASNNKEFGEGFQKHFKFSENSYGDYSTTLIPIYNMNYEYDKLYTPAYLLNTSIDLLKTTNHDQSLILTFKKGDGLRTLKSIDMTYEDNDKDINEAIELNLNEVKDAINEVMNLTNFNVITGEVNDVINEDTTLNSHEVDDKINATNFQNLSEDGDIVNETLAFNLTTENNNDIINEPSANEVSNKIHGIYAFNAANNKIPNENSSDFTIRKSLRVLKSIDLPDGVIIDGIFKNNAIKVTKTNVTKKNETSTYDDQVNKTISEANTLNLNTFVEKNYEVSTQNLTKTSESKRNFNNTRDGIISFISMMSDWFRTMTSLSGAIKKELKDESKGNNNSKSNVTMLSTKKKSLEENITKDVLYPSYDVEMVDNIGHRSRVLLSFDDKTTVQDKLVKKNISKSNTEKAVTSEINEVLPIALVLATNDTNKTNKTVKKRNVDKNLVFWNDLYDDDEYGVKVDYMDNVRDKHSVKKVKNILNKSKDWLANKCSNVKNKLRRKSKTTKKKTTNIPTDKISEKLCNSTCKPPEVIKERFVRNSDINDKKSIKKSFAELNANMKKVCQEAAKAIQDTKNIEARENSKENEAATSLMQNLVRMMSELVDIQVQQKTCAKLPSDLYNFLEWLTAPNDDKVQGDEWRPVAYDYNDAIRYVKSTEPFEYPTTLTEDTHQDDRTECLGTIRAVQDLIQQYEGMTDEDKSKMTGVKEYLENQLLFLNNKLNYLYDPNLFKLYEKRELQRKRRDTSTKKQDKEKVSTETVKSDGMKKTGR